MEVTAEVFKYRYDLSKTVHDPVILDSVSVDSNARRVLENKLGLSRGYMNVIFNKLRSCKIIVDGRLNPKFVPNVKVDESTNTFSVLLLFDFNGDKKTEK